jgi:DNA adenine methylase Dam
VLASDTRLALVKSPLNYTGGKFKLLPQILPLLPDDIGTFVDAFGGGGNVLANVAADAHIYNDWDADVSNLLRWLSTKTPEAAVGDVEMVIDTFGLNKSNKDGFYQCRAYFNDGAREPAVFYALIAHAFNNQIRFNSKGGYNIPFGTDRSEFNPALRERFLAFTERLNSMSTTFATGDFTQVVIPDNAFVYCDPPYLISDATYNKSSGGWGHDDEARLEEWLRGLDARGIRWALSNVMEHQGHTNVALEKFSADFNVRDLTASYANASYHKKDRVSKSREVLVTNFTL